MRVLFDGGVIFLYGFVLWSSSFVFSSFFPFFFVFYLGYTLTPPRPHKDRSHACSTHIVDTGINAYSSSVHTSVYCKKTAIQTLFRQLNIILDWEGRSSFCRFSSSSSSYLGRKLMCMMNEAISGGEKKKKKTRETLPPSSFSSSSRYRQVARSEVVLSLVLFSVWLL